MEVKIYTLPDCPHCHHAKDFFNQNNIKFKEIDISTDEKGRSEAIEKAKSVGDEVGTPVIDIDGKIVVGFDKEKLEKILGI